MRRVALTAFLVALALLAAAARAGTVATDPRCAGYTCTLDRQATFDPSFVNDATTCANGTECPLCLTGPTWEQRIAELGAKVPRDFDFYLVFNNWLSAELSDTITKILLQEVLGFRARAAPVPIDGTMDTICCTEPVFEFELWPAGRFPDDDGYFTVSSLAAGYEGGSGLFIPDYMAEALPLATSYNAYKFLPQYAAALPAGMSTNCSLLIKDPTLGCVEGNYYCDDNQWTGNATCRQGRYIPPQCEADPTQCREIYLADPTYDPVRFEALIRNSGLPFVLAYLGAGGLPTYVQQQAALRRNFIFYWWEPDPLPASVGARQVTFPPNNFECEQAYLRGEADPNANAFDCAYPVASLLKVGRRSDLAKSRAFKHFFESFLLSNSHMSSMLRRHTSAGGNATVYDLSCGWVRDNFQTWRSWVYQAPPTAAPADAVAAQGGTDNSALIPAIVVPIATVLLVAVAVAVVFNMRARAAVKHAPKAPPLALVFTDVESSTALWEAYGNDMATAMETHHAVVRRVIDEFNCYEVKTIGDAFMIACPSVLDATLVAIEIQNRLHNEAWPEAILHWNAGNAAADALAAAHSAELSDVSSVALTDVARAAVGPPFRGLNVRMGVHLCQEVEPKFDVIHQRYDYYGHDVNVAARVQSAAHGGQILMTAETLTALQADPDFESMLSLDVVTTLASNGIELKGVSVPVAMYSVLPVALAHRRFEPLEGAPGGTARGDGSDALDIAKPPMLDVGPVDDPAQRYFDMGVMCVLEHLAATGGAGDRAASAMCTRLKLTSRGGSTQKTIRLLAHALRKQCPAGIASQSSVPSTPMSTTQGTQQSARRRGSLIAHTNANASAGKYTAGDN